MADSRHELWGCAGLAAVFVAIAWFVTAPSSDQVCRNKVVPILDRLHGVDGQPTCQQLINQLDAQAAESRRRNEELDGRISEIETRLNM